MAGPCLVEQGWEAVHRAAREAGPVTLAVAHAVDEGSVETAVRAARSGLALPLLVGPEGQVRRRLAAAGAAPEIDVIDAPDEARSAATAVRLCREGRAGALLKGALHTHVLLGCALDRDRGLRTGRLLSDLFFIEDPRPHRSPRLVAITDGGVNVAPELEQKAAIVSNAIEALRALGAHPVRVALLAAVEVPTPTQPHSREAAELAARRYPGAIVEGPLALDVALEQGCAVAKGLEGSGVAGRVHVLVAPTLESANILAKSVQYFGMRQPGHLLVGARVPILLNSRSETAEARLHSVALARCVSGGGPP